MKKLFFVIGIFCVSQGLSAQTDPNRIRINQLGYYVLGPKIAIITDDFSATTFYILPANGNDTVYRGRTGEIRASSNSSLKTRMADFTAFTHPGKFVLVVPGLPHSYPFNINANVNHNAAVASLKGYYYIRASMALEPQFAGKWARTAGHPDDVVLVHPAAASEKRPANTRISTPGGWYDAGDYNKYVVNSGITMGTLLSAYEDFPAYYDTLHINIPESGDGLPDLLNEVLYNLRWMLTMQDPNDGGVYNKCTNAAFDGMVMPDVTKLPRYVVPKGTAATLDFAAVMAQGSRIFKKFGTHLPGLSDSCLARAKLAWRWAEAHPALAYDQDAMNKGFEPKVTTGGYGDREFSDEWFWSASELYTTTNNNTYASVISRDLNDAMTLPSWGNVRMLGFYTLLRKQAPMASEPSYLPELKNRLVIFADTLVSGVNRNAFHTVMGRSARSFNWGSNSTAANEGIALINAYRLTKNKKYVDAALTNLDYILGRNATGYCFVTGIGSFSTMHPHHRPSVADGIVEPVPGLLAGGPNPGRQDHCEYRFTEPETAYTDVDCSYASNEIAINWNAPLVYLANAIEALQYEVKYSVSKRRPK